MSKFLGITEEMLRHMFSPADIETVLGENKMRVMEDCVVEWRRLARLRRSRGHWSPYEEHAERADKVHHSEGEERHQV